MRARSAKQRFPVAQWVEDLEVLQSTSIRIHSKALVKSHGQPYTPSGFNSSSRMLASPVYPMTPTGMQTPPVAHSREGSYSNGNRFSSLGPQQINTIIYSRDPSPDRNEKPKTGLSRQLSLGLCSGPGHVQHRRRKLRKSNIPTFEENITPVQTDAEDDSEDENIPGFYGEDEYMLSPEEAEESRRMEMLREQAAGQAFMPYRSSYNLRHASHSSFTAGPGTSSPGDDGLLPPARPFAETSPATVSAARLYFLLTPSSATRRTLNCKRSTRSSSRTARASTTNSSRNASRTSAARTRKHSSASRNFWKIVRRSGSTSSGTQDSAAVTTRQLLLSPVVSAQHGLWARCPTTTCFFASGDEEQQNKEGDEFLLGEDYVPPSGLRKWMQLRIGDWPVYSFFLGLGQIIAANYYQITLLTGEVGQTPEKLYGIATVYLVTSIIWWFIFRSFKSIVSLSLPWFFYGLAFTLIGVAHWESNEFNRGWTQNVASGVYAVSSSSGSIFFSLNFGDESGASVREWVFRACMIQGLQQAYIIGLWYWGSTITRATSQGITDPQGSITNTWKMTYVSLSLYSHNLLTMIVLFVYQLPSFSGQSACFFTLVFQTITVKHPARCHHSTRPSSDARSSSGTLLW